MALTAGTRLGPYEITGPIGTGGMGEVYLATDTKLKRHVAIKILPLAVAANAERLARFHREAEVLASLNHPNIAAIYGFEDSGATHALVMELVEGSTLADRIAQGAIPVAETLPIATQIAEALEAAHEQGIIHRDLKPANIKVRPDGTVKVLDFGLAKALDRPQTSNPQPRENFTESPTLTSPALMTGAGMILGTAAYMAPEQAKGKAVDRRADIWAFGAVLFEMLTGKRAFPGADVTDTIVSVMSQEPDWSALPPAVPAGVRRMLRRCLDRDVKRRLQAIGEARVALDDEAGEADTTTAVVSTEPVAKRSSRTWMWIAATSALFAVALGTSYFAWRATRPVERPLMRFTDQLETGLNGGVAGSAVALSRDGSRLAFISRDARVTHVSVRRLDDPKASVLADTEGADAPFFSPDGRWIAFFVNTSLKKVSVEGGAAVTICQLTVPPRGGGFWADDNTIFFAGQRTPVLRVPANGGTPAPVTTLDEKKKELSNRAAQLLPGGDAILFEASTDNNAWEDATVDVQSLKTGERRTLVQGGYYGRYLPGSDPFMGHLIYMDNDTLFAAPMDVKRLTLIGQAQPVVEDISTRALNGLAYLDVTPGGMLAYVAGANDLMSLLFWWDASGGAQVIQAPPAPYVSPRISPDGSRIVVRINSAAAAGLGVLEWAQNRLTRLSAASGVASAAAWAADGKHVVVQLTSQAVGGPGLYWLRADGAGSPQKLIDGLDFLPWRFTPDGKRLAYSWTNGVRQEIWTLPVDLTDPERPKAGKPERFYIAERDGASVGGGAFSPDGRWIAYESNESGPREIYVQAFPGAGGKWQVSTDSGVGPLWSPNRRELFYQHLDANLLVPRASVMGVSYTVSGDSFVPGQPRQLSSTPFPTPLALSFDLAPDGKRFLAAMPSSAAGGSPPPVAGVTFLLNFADELRRKVPADK